MPNGRGSARSFFCKDRDPQVFTCHEPHGKDPLSKGTLREYVEVKLKLTRKEFLDLYERS